LVATVSTIIALSSVGAAFTAIDSRYALAGDFETYKLNTQQQLQVYQMENRAGMLELRRQSLEDAIFTLESKNSLSDLDKALLNRYKLHLQDVVSRQRQFEAAAAVEKSKGVQ